MGPLDKNEVYYVEEDFFANAGIEIMDQPMKRIVDQKQEVLMNDATTVHYDKILLASGIVKQQLRQRYENVLTITDH